MTDELARIRAVFGNDIKSFEYNLSSGRRHGYARIVNRGGDLHPSPAAIDLAQRATDLRAHGVQVFVGGGGEYVPYPTEESDPIYVLPGITVLDVIEFARTGSHNAPIWGTWDEQNAAMKLTTDWTRLPGFTEGDARAAYASAPHGRTPWKIVQNAVESFLADHPFQILFADAAGLWAVFERPPGPSEAHRIARIILRLSPEAADGIGPVVEALRAENCEKRPEVGHSSPQADMADFIAATGTFELWWD